jgi:hypothetical protein
MKILYVHGYNGHGDGSKAKIMRKLLPDAEIVAPQMSNDVSKVKEDVALIEKLGADCDVAFGTSYGGFLVLCAKLGINKFVHNPCLFPINVLSRLDGVEPNLYERYLREFELRLPRPEDVSETNGIFADGDSICKFKKAFDAMYRGRSTTMSGEHYMRPEDVEVVTRAMLRALDKSRLFESNEAIPLFAIR